MKKKKILHHLKRESVPPKAFGTSSHSLPNFKHTQLQNLQEAKNGRKIPRPLTDIVLNTLEQGSENFYKGSDSKHFRFGGPHGHCLNYVTSLLQHRALDNMQMSARGSVPIKLYLERETTNRGLNLAFWP